MHHHIARWIAAAAVVATFAIAAPSATASPNVRIWAVDAANSRVYLKNFGTSTQVMTGWWLCNFPAYSQFSATLAPGEAVGLTFNFSNPADAEMGLYINSSFGTAASMVDYLDWGTAGGGRAGVAASAGLWPAGDVVTVLAPYGYTGDGTQRGAAFWATGTANVRIVAADTTANTLRLRNFGTATQDVSAWWLCSLFAYLQTSSMPVLEGSPARVLEPGEELLVMWPNVNATPRDMGLYRTASFASASSMVDFLQWGSGGNGRESVAVTAGYWSSGDFVPGDSPYTFTGGAADRGVTFWAFTATGAGRVPDGDLVPGTPLGVGKLAGGDLALSWGGSCRSGDTDYGVYEGALGGTFDSHVGLVCSTGGATSAALTPGAGSTYYLIVPQNGSLEGGYGSASSGPRTPVAGACHPQSELSCE